MRQVLYITCTLSILFMAKVVVDILWVANKKLEIDPNLLNTIADSACV